MKPITLSATHFGKIIVFGDWHGSLKWAKRAITEAMRDHPNIDYFFHIGDFGYFEENEHYIKELSKLLQNIEKTLIFIDGNHENHHILDSAQNRTGLDPISPRIFYARRGTLFSWNDLLILTFGGAYSIDRKWRTLNETYWEEEEITSEQIEQFKANPARPQIMLTHDAPSRPPNINPLNPQYFSPATQEKADLHMEKIKTIMGIAKPDTLIHGHFHHKYHNKYFNTDIYGLDCDGSSWRKNRLVINPTGLITPY